MSYTVHELIADLGNFPPLTPVKLILSESPVEYDCGKVIDPSMEIVDLTYDIDAKAVLLADYQFDYVDPLDQQIADAEKHYGLPDNRPWEKLSTEELIARYAVDIVWLERTEEEGTVEEPKLSVMITGPNLPTHQWAVLHWKITDDMPRNQQLREAVLIVVRQHLERKGE